MLRRWLQGLFVCVLAMVMLGAGDSVSRFNKIGHEMICQCGCGQVMLECNHVNCPVSPVMRNELQTQINAAGSDTMVLNWFEAKYGAIVLAAPIRGGFDNVAWIVPAAVFGLAIVGTAILIWVWKRRTVRLAPVGSSDVHVDAMRERIRRETEYR